MTSIPLGVVLEEGAKTRRHCIPYLTYQRTLTNCCPFASLSDVKNHSSSKRSDHGVATEESGVYQSKQKIDEKTCFFHYLLSNETRLPNHPLLVSKGAAPEDYDTYVGVEMLPKKQNGKSDDEEQDENSLLSCPSLPSFSEAIDWITSALEFLSSLEADDVVFTQEFAHASGGAPPPRSGCVLSSSSSGITIPSYQHAGVYQVVLGGKYGIVDDCPWAVPSHSSKLSSTKDVVVAMLSSAKFSKDLERQRMEIQEGRATSMEFSLIRAMGNGGADEWRVFIPYRVLSAPSPIDASSRADDRKTLKSFSVPLYSLPHVSSSSSSSLMLVPFLPFAAVTQRCTDVCFPEFVRWSEENHHDHHQQLVQRVMAANLLGQWQQSQVRACGYPHSCDKNEAEDSVSTPKAASSLELALENCVNEIRRKKCSLWEERKSACGGGRTLDHSGAVNLSSEKNKQKFSEEQEAVLLSTDRQNEAPFRSALPALPTYPFRDPLVLKDMLLVLAVDVLWSSPTLPVYVLSGKFHLFLRPEGEKENSTENDFNHTNELELKENEKQSSAVEKNDSIYQRIPWIWISDEDCISSNGGSENISKQITKPETTLETDLSTLSSSDSCAFWCLLRSTAQWNKYLQNVQNARKRALSCVHDEKIVENCKHNNLSTAKSFPSFCVIATDGDDLFAQKKDECSSGLPLEFLHPELLADNPEFLAVFQKWKDQQLEAIKKVPIV